MIFLEAAKKAAGWKPGMELWIVISFSAELNQGKQSVSVTLIRPWPHHVYNRATLEFAYDGVIPYMFDGPFPRRRTLGEMDRGLCPEGTIFVWDESHDVPEYNQR